MIGSSIAHYQVLSELGAGGMGVVYRALDTRLQREVAIKALPEAFASDSERLARFEREARTLASLNHPHIGGIHGLEEVDGRRFLILELVEGESLAERLQRGPVPVREALELARQLAEGLETAHEAGVVHRDLKPGNVQVTPEGQVKVLDFGLAKPMGKGSAVDLSLSPTMTYSPTEAGVLLGTAAYMSPEQARGQAVDRRADIWGFGCVLYEMLTGKRPFLGATVTDLLAAVVREDPDLDRLPGDTPWRVRELLRRCFEKEAHFRLRDIGDARIELHDAISRPDETPPGATAAPAARTAAPRFDRWALAAAAAGALIASLAWWVAGRGDATGSRLAHVSLRVPSGWRAESVRISPDGRAVAYHAAPEADTGGSRRAHLRAHLLDRIASLRIPSSDRAQLYTFSDDGRELAFVAPESPDSSRNAVFVWTVGEETPPLSLRTWDATWKLPDWFGGLVWLPDGDLVALAAGAPNRLVRIPTDGRPPPDPVALTGVPAAAEVTLVSALPDGTLLGELSTWQGGYKVDVARIDSLSGEVEILLRNGATPSHSPTGHLVFNRRSQLLAAPFDLESGRVTGAAVAVLGAVRSDAYSLRSQLALARNGTLAHLGGTEIGRRRSLVLVGRDRLETWATDLVTADNTDIDVSSDGRWVAFTVMNRDLLFEVWGSELAQPAIRRLAALPGMDCSWPALSSDARLLAYQCVGETTTRGIYLSPVDGSAAPRLILEQDPSLDSLQPEAFSPGGGELLVQSGRGEQRELLSIALGAESAAEPRLLLDSGYVGGAELSPDGTMLAYHSHEAGRWEVFVRNRRADGTLEAAVPVGVGSRPVWDGRAGGTSRLLYLTPDYRMVAVPIDRGRAGAAAEILGYAAIQADLVSADYVPDDRVLALLRGKDELPPDQIELVLGFDAELGRLAPAGR